MQEHTRYRLNVLDNGYWPLLNNCKRPIGKDWQRKRPDRAKCCHGIAARSRRRE